ncbi:MAG: DUF2125 domain-containing protein [Rhodobacteraceae bacterium]|nr:DUF2125 domain-containing protein [Paracoccaceae bacterium]
MTAPLRLAVLSAAASLAAGTASADLTAAQVWADWQESAASLGQTLSVGSEESGSGSLTLRDVSITMDGPDGGVNGTIAEVVMTEQGDGTVAIEMSPELPLDFTSLGPDGEQAEFSVVIDQSALDLVASGAEGAVSYAYSAPTMSITLTSATTNGEPMDVDGAVTLAGLEGSYAVTEGSARTVDSALRASTITVDFGGTDPESAGDTFAVSMSMSDLDSQSTGTMSPLMGMANLGEMVGAGLATSGTTTHGPATLTVTGTSAGSAFKIDGAYQSGAYDVAIGESGLDYGYTGRGFTLSASGDQIPFPDASLSAEEIGSRLAMPVTVSEEPGDVALALRLVGFSLSDQLWSMLDPGAVLPRDPASLVVDVTGKANWLVDVFDPALANTPMDAPPGELHALTVREILLRIAGAELTGSGDFTMNNDAPMPMPAGTLNLRLVGGNGLIDKLVQMGLVPEDQAMGARMMLGLFARPGDGADTLVSEITLQEDGAILANGQRIR